MGRMARPFGLAGSASAGALPQGFTSAMLLDAKRRDRSSSRSPSPRPLPRRLITESRSAPKLFGAQPEELPPLARESAYDDMFRQTPSPSSFAAVQWGSPTGRLRPLPNLNRAAKGAQLKTRYSPREAQWRASA